MSKLENAIINFFGIRTIHLVLIIALSIRTLGGYTIFGRLPQIIIVFFIYMTIYHVILRKIFNRTQGWINHLQKWRGKSMKRGDVSKELIKVIDKVITDVVNSTLVDVETKKEVKQSLVRIVHISLKQAKNDPDFIDSYDRYYQLLMSDDKWKLNFLPLCWRKMLEVDDFFH